MITINPLYDAWINVDVQGAFLPGGGLGVPGADSIIPVIRKNVVPLFPDKRGRFATCDMHEDGSVSLSTTYVDVPPNTLLTLGMVESWTDKNLAVGAKFNLARLRAYLRIKSDHVQMAWNRHGVDPSDRKFPSELPESLFGYIQGKGHTDPVCDSYSGFRDPIGRPTGLTSVLRKNKFQRLFLTGLLKNYCVGLTGLDGVADGFKVYIIDDGTYELDEPAGSVSQMNDKFRDADIRIITSDMMEAA